SNAQDNKPRAHQYYINLMGNARDSLYNKAMDKYNNYLERNPSDYLISIERCKLIENAYYDIYDDYNPKYTEWEESLESLLKAFPDNSDVLLYKAETMYGDEAHAFVENLANQIKDNSGPWENKAVWKVYQKLAEFKSHEGLTKEAILYGELAISHNDTLDMKFFLAQQYTLLPDKNKARELIANSIDSTNSSWVLTQKGNLMLELNMPDKALEAFRMSVRETNAWIDYDSLAKALIENELTAVAREYLAKDVEQSWDKSQAFLKLFYYDLEYGVPDSALSSYRGLQRATYGKTRWASLESNYF
ncbi:MAG: hypothetical protein H0X62_06530, partial [Bacteroidetes bacterium]|nr:hypothetical protein [Bacteroidota bacterium]